MVGLRIPLAGFWIPKPWIPDSTDQNYLDSGFPYMGRYTPYDVTRSRPRKTTIAFFANFGGIEKLFREPDQSLNSKIIYESVQHRLQFSGIKQGG